MKFDISVIFIFCKFNSLSYYFQKVQKKIQKYINSLNLYVYNVYNIKIYVYKKYMKIYKYQKN